jgi:membrane-associated phospholipid phosphatase
MDISWLFIKVTADFLIIPMIIIGGWVGIRLIFDRKKTLVTKAIITGAAAFALAKLASLFYQGERPFVQQGVAPGAAYLNNPGFPSDHALLAFVVVYIVWGSTKNIPLTIALLVCAVLISLGRIMALVHTPVDVIGGFGCATIAAIVIYGKDFFTLQESKSTKSLPEV